MKTKETHFPNLESLVSGFSDNESITKTSTDRVNNFVDDPEISIDPRPNNGDTLWEKLNEMVVTSKDIFQQSKKSYRIDDDIVETLAQCNFNASTTCVINCILRTFIIAHISDLSKIRLQKPKTIFDQFTNNKLS